MARLCDPVEVVLAENQEMNLRLRKIDNAVTGQAGSTEIEGGRDTSVTPSGTATPLMVLRKILWGGCNGTILVLPSTKTCLDLASTGNFSSVNLAIHSLCLVLG